MSETATYTFSHSGNALFTPAEVMRLMEVEYERSKRYGFPVACLQVAVDRLQDLTTMHGTELREKILDAVIDLLRQETRVGDLLGFQRDDSLTAVLPHTNAAGVGFLANRLLLDARTLRFSSGGTNLRVTLSIGISHTQHKKAKSLASMLAMAEEGVNVALAAGGDRWAETQLYDLQERQSAPLPKPAPPEIAGPPDSLRARLLELMTGGSDLEVAAAALAEEILQRATKELREEVEGRPTAADPGKELEYQREIDNLRRRVAKLTQSLGLTEQELLRVRALKNVDDGIESIYRQVQGLSGADDRTKIKQSLMESIFQANLDLRQKRTG